MLRLNDLPLPVTPAPVPAAQTGLIRRATDLTRHYLPGLWLVITITAAAYGLRGSEMLRTLSPMIIGIILGVVLCNLTPLPAQAQPGLRLAGKGLLRAAVALLGVQITFDQIVALGPWSLASAVIVVGATFFFTVLLGRVMGVATPLATLIAAGTSVCGAAAIAGVNGAVRAKEEDVTYAVAAITLLGTLAMFAYPLIGAAIGLDPARYGTWIGLSVHEVAQVVGAGFQAGEEAGRVAVVVKLTRVVLLAALVFGLVAWFSRGKDTAAGASAPGIPLVPWFVVAFLALSGVNSLGLVPDVLRELAIAATPILLTAALSALGLGTHFGKLRQLGVRPLVLCLASTGFIAVLSLVLSAV